MERRARLIAFRSPLFVVALGTRRSSRVNPEIRRKVKTRPSRAISIES